MNAKLNCSPPVLFAITHPWCMHMCESCSGLPFSFIFLDKSRGKSCPGFVSLCGLSLLFLTQPALFPLFFYLFALITPSKSTQQSNEPTMPKRRAKADQRKRLNVLAKRLRISVSELKQRLNSNESGARPPSRGEARKESTRGGVLD
jgi:hypothetical protein